MLALLLATISHAALADTYTYSAPTYNSFTDSTPPCGVCPNFTPAMRVAGSFTTSTPLPPNLSAAEITPRVSGFFFSDGLATYASSDPQVRVHRIFATTNAAGQVTSLSMQLQRWQVPAAAHPVGATIDIVDISTASSAARHNFVCTVILPSGFNGVADVCFSGNFDSASSSANENDGAAVVRQVSMPQAIPSLNEVCLALLAFIALATGIAQRRRAGQ